MEAAKQATSSPLLEEGGVEGAKGILINITGSSRLGIHDVNAACSLIRQAANNDDVQINFGVVLNEAMGESVKITVIATGFQRHHLPVIERKPMHETPSLEVRPVESRPIEIVAQPLPQAVSVRPAVMQEPEAVDVSALAETEPAPEPVADSFFEPRTSHEPPAGPRTIPNWGRFEPVFEPEPPRAPVHEPIPMPLRATPTPPAAPMPTAMPTAMPTPISAPAPEPPMAAPQPASQPPAPPAKDDLEIPAFLRRERKLFQ